jgi:cell division protein FtsL
MTRTNLVLIFIVVLCALATINANHRARRAFIALEAEQKRNRNLDIEWGQLQLEQSTWAGHVRIEKYARDKLDMRTPQAGQVLMVEPTATGSATAQTQVGQP